MFDWLVDKLVELPKTFEDSLISELGVITHSYLKLDVFTTENLIRDWVKDKKKSERLDPIILIEVCIRDEDNGVFYYIKNMIINYNNTIININTNPKKILAKTIDPDLLDIIVSQKDVLLTFQ